MVTAMHFLGALALLCVGPTSRDTLSGRVTDSDGAPVPAATVLISELHRVATTGADGGFGLAGLPPGEYTVIVRQVGFAPFARQAAASVLFGSDALGGVVNVIPAERPDANGGRRMIRTGFEVSGATNNAEVEAAARIEGASGAWAWRAFGIGRAAGSLHTPAGELDNTGFGALNGEAAVGRRGAGGSTTLRYTRYAGEFKLLEANEPPSGAEEGGPERKLSDDRVQLAGDYRVGSLRLETRTQWQRHSLVEVSDTGTSPTGTPLEGTAFDLLLNTTSLDVLAHHGAGSAVRGTVGVSGLYQTNETRGPIPLVPDARTRSAAAFVFEQATRGRWSVLAGGRVDLRRLTADSNATLTLAPQRRDYTAWSGDAGLVYRPVETLAITANVGRAWRAPTLFELFSNGPHLGEARYEIGDPGLKRAARHRSASISPRPSRCTGGSTRCAEPTARRTRRSRSFRPPGWPWARSCTAAPSAGRIGRGSRSTASS